MITMAVAKGIIKEDDLQLEKKRDSLRQRIREMNIKIRGRDYVDRITRTSR